MSLDALAERLAAIGCVAPREEAQEMLESARSSAELESFVVRRSEGEPLAWITGWVEFCGRKVHVDPGVYVPRFETEQLTRRAATVLRPGDRAVDLCTGAGAIASALKTEVSGAAVVGVDLDPRAVACCRRNGVPVVLGDLGAPLRRGTFDVVTAVAPYVPTGQLRFLPADVQRHEPVLALDGGHDGLSVVRRVVAEAGRLLRPGGSLFVEVGAEQDAALGGDLAGAGLEVTDRWWDEDGDLRGLSARRAKGWR